MNDEDTWQDLIDKDRSIIPIYCDWLAEQNDPREEGYRVLHLLGKSPTINNRKTWYYRGPWGSDGSILQDDLLTPWYDYYRQPANELFESNAQNSPDIRRKIDNVAALAWNEIPIDGKRKTLKEHGVDYDEFRTGGAVMAITDRQG